MSDAADDKLAASMTAAQSAQGKKAAVSRPTVPPRKGPASVAKAIAPANHKPAAKQAIIEDAFPYETAFRIAFIGSGQGGGRMANEFYNLGYRRVCVFNTAGSDFSGIAPEIAKLDLGVGGAAKDPNFAAGHLRSRNEELWDLFVRGWGSDFDYALVCVGLGGGTGSGTVGLLIEQARKYMESKGKTPKVGVVLSLPPSSEGQQQSKNAVHAFRTIMELKASPIVVIDNGRIHELYKPGYFELYSIANKTVSQLFHLFNQLAAVHSPLITFDRSELGQLLDGGIVVMGTADFAMSDITSPADISSRVRDELARNVLASCDLRKGKKATCLFVGDDQALTDLDLDFFEAGFNQLDRLVGTAHGKQSPTVIHRGVYPSGEAGSGLQCYTMVSELEPPYDRLSELAKKGLIEQASTIKGIASFLGVQD